MLKFRAGSEQEQIPGLLFRPTGILLSVTEAF